ncbi:MAG: SDR family oxidoreductase [Chloroflexi bacterium]|nr:SDR family oxidoreductase [Chloroflexota bacterium]
MKLTGTVALVTGAGRGLGKEIARQLAERGVKLVLTARTESELELTVAKVCRLTEAVALAGDVAEPAHAERLVRLARKRFGPVDILINNASSLGPSPMPLLEAYPLDALHDVLRVNVVAPLHLAQLVLPEMKARGDGLILNVSSDAAVEAYPTWGGYGASKAALEHLSRVLAAELEGTGVRVFVVDPGDMNTRMHQEAEPDVDLSHLPDPTAVAPAAVRIIEDSDERFGRFQAQRLPAAIA